MTSASPRRTTADGDSPTRRATSAAREMVMLNIAASSAAKPPPRAAADGRARPPLGLNLALSSCVQATVTASIGYIMAYVPIHGTSLGLRGAARLTKTALTLFVARGCTSRVFYYISIHICS